ncbi:protein of unknown function [Burkholderia multivorans]
MVSAPSLGTATLWITERLSPRRVQPLERPASPASFSVQSFLLRLAWQASSARLGHLPGVSSNNTVCRHVSNSFMMQSANILGNDTSAAGREFTEKYIASDLKNQFVNMLVANVARG